MLTKPMRGLEPPMFRNLASQGRYVRLRQRKSLRNTPRPAAKRYHGAVKLDPTRVGRDAAR